MLAFNSEWNDKKTPPQGDHDHKQREKITKSQNISRFCKKNICCKKHYSNPPKKKAHLCLKSSHPFSLFLRHDMFTKNKSFPSQHHGLRIQAAPNNGSLRLFRRLKAAMDEFPPVAKQPKNHLIQQVQWGWVGVFLVFRIVYQEVALWNMRW